MTLTERAPLLGARGDVERAWRVDDVGDDDDDDARARTGASASASAHRGARERAIACTESADPLAKRRSSRAYGVALALCAAIVLTSTMLLSGGVAFVRAATAAEGRMTGASASARVGVAPRARETLSAEQLKHFPWLIAGKRSGGGASKGSSGGEGDDVGALGAFRALEREDPLESELARNAHALDRARTVEDFVAMSVQVDDAHAVGQKPLSSWKHKPFVQGATEASRLYGNDAFSVCLYNLHHWSRPFGTSTWTEDLSESLDAKRGVRSALHENLRGRCVKEVTHSNSRSSKQCLQADVVVFRGDTMLRDAKAKLGRTEMHRNSTRKAGRDASVLHPFRRRAHKEARLGVVDELLTQLPQKSRRDQVFVYVSTASPGSVYAGEDLRDQALLSEVDYLATSNRNIESVWRSPLPSAKFMISSFDAFIRPVNMRMPLLGFGDTITQCRHGSEVGAHILRRISEKFPVHAFGTCMKNVEAPWYIPNLGFSMSSAEAIRVQLSLSAYLFFYVSEDADCPGHVTEKLWLPLLRGSIPVYFGTKSVEDFLPCPNKDCVLSVKDFNSVDELVTRMHEIANNPALYEQLTAWRYNTPSHWPEAFREGVARASQDIQSVVCDILRDGDDAQSRGSVSAFATMTPHSAPWLLGSYPNEKIDTLAVSELERSGEKSSVYCVRQDRVSALGERYFERKTHAAETSKTWSAMTNTTTESDDQDKDQVFAPLADPAALYTKICDYESSACVRLHALD